MDDNPDGDLDDIAQPILEEFYQSGGGNQYQQDEYDEDNYGHTDL